MILQNARVIFIVENYKSVYSISQPDRDEGYTRKCCDFRLDQDEFDFVTDISSGISLLKSSLIVHTHYTIIELYWLRKCQ